MARFAWGPSWTHGATQHVMIQLIPAATAPNSCSRPILRMIRWRGPGGLDGLP